MAETLGTSRPILWRLLAPEDAQFQAIREANEEAGLPSIDVPALLGKFLDLMVRISGARGFWKSAR